MKAASALYNGRRRRRRRTAAVGRVVKPLGDPREGGAADEGPQLRVHRGEPAAQERAPAQL